MTLLRAMDPAFSTDADILKAFYPVEEIKVTPGQPANLVKKIACGDVIDTETGEVLLDASIGDLEISEETAEKIAKSSCATIAVIDPKKIKDRIILESLKEDHGGKGQQADGVMKTHEQALLKIYQRLRPGNPPQLEKARELFREKFQDANRYRLGRV